MAARTTDVRAPRLAVAAVLVAVGIWTVLILVIPPLHFSVELPQARLGIEIGGTAVATLAAALAYLSYSVSGSLSSLLIALAFVPLIANHLAFGVAIPVSQVGTRHALYFWTTGRLLAAGLLLAGALSRRRTERRPAHPFQRFALSSVAILAVLGLVDGVLWAEREALPPLSTFPGPIDPATLSGPIPGIHPVVAAVEALGMTLLLTAALLYLLRPGTGWEARWLPSALVFAAFAHVHYMLFPTVFSDVVSTGDLLRLAFSAALLLGLMWEIRRTYFSEMARAAELAETLTAERARVEELEELDRARARLFGTLAHELMHPVAAIRTLTVALLKRWDDLSEDRRRDMLSVIDSETSHLREMTERAAISTQMQVGTFTVSPRPQRAGDLARQAAEACAPTPVVIDLDPDADDATVMADPPRILQVFRNLLSNAVKFSPPGSPVELATRHADGEVVFTVADRGPGVPPEDRVRLFQPFSRLAPDSGPPGSGLGLYVSRQIVEAHGGRIWVDAASDLGSRFSFTLPRA
jgi:signal transduction histidine kinase